MKNVLALLLVAALSAGVTVFVARLTSHPPETPALAQAMSGDERQNVADVAALSKRFGPNRNSQYFEEWIVRDYFGDKRDGIFVDIGANHFKNGSNTYYLESALNWSGLAVDPQADFAAGYASNRPRTRFFAMFVSDKTNETARVSIVGGNPDQATAFPRKPVGNETVKEFDAPTITLTDLLDQAKLAHVDFLSIDVELAEPDVLRGFDIERFKPSLVCIEGHKDVRQQVLEYFAKHGYVLVGKYLRVDIHNLYFERMKSMN